MNSCPWPQNPDCTCLVNGIRGTIPNYCCQLQRLKTALTEQLVFHQTLVVYQANAYPGIDSPIINFQPYLKSIRGSGEYKLWAKKG